ncbi:peptidase Do [Prevotella disiens JCM 6334 = ATCC 29426]|uniref:Peptidase Do n=2 Tax=Prevotella disiens TaxID=28130 RepID=A0ABP2Y7U5_9BACT|nr:trypsin-like peptidase domain-containing protein [Prevotella disiens]ERJ77379.1 peptidase Do [Prevotella disiens JCM 6334 = ATCC 29426]SUB85843.1 Probable periplasmic serine endoprotease DegP-like precursor [Prevotella disiens]
MKKMGNFLVGASCVLALTFSTTAFIKAYGAETKAVAPGQPVDLTYAAEKALPAVVHIKNAQNSKTQMVEVPDDPFGGFFDFFGFGNPGGGSRQQQIQTPKRQLTGSGVIISEDGYIVTNNHVVEGADELTVTLNDNREFSARVVGTDKSTDLALIKVSGKNLPTLPIGNSDNLKVGEWVIAVGNPYNLNNTVTAGIVSAKARGLGATQGGVESFIQTDAAINQGNSGGALVNVQGELVGINAMLYSQTGSYSGYGFAIPTVIMNKVVDDIKKYGSVQRVILGIQGGDVINYINAQKEEGKTVDLGTNEGVYVDKVSEEGNGAEIGLHKKDVIVKFDGKKVTKMSELQQLLNTKRPGDKASITFLRDKKEITKTITLKNAQGTTKPIEQADIDVLGGQFRPITDATKKQLNIKFGLEVMKINSGALRNAGINRGFIIQKVNDEVVNSIEGLQRLVKIASTSKDPVLYIQGVYPTGKKAYYAVPLVD